MNGAPEEPARNQAPDPDGVPTTVTRRHAAAPRGRSPWPVLVPVAVALVVVVALLAAWSTLQSRGGAEAGAPLASAPAVPVAATPSSDAGTPVATTSPSQRPSKRPSHGPSPATSSSRPSPTTTGGGRQDPPLPRWARDVPVGVLNATSRTGLAASVAARLRAKGWTVVAAANWRAGNVHRTTIFTTGHVRAVSTLRHDVPAVTAVRVPLAGMSTDRIVLVLADDYPS